MKVNELFEIIGDIDEKKIEKAAFIHSKRKLVFIKWASLAACIALIAAAGNLTADRQLAKNSEKNVIVSDCRSNSQEKDSAEEVIKSRKEAAFDSYDGDTGGKEDLAAAGAKTESTENESRKKVGIAVADDSVIEENGEFSYDYLTQLQSRISEAMMNGEFPFVISAHVMESSNRVEVSVTTDAEEELIKVKALDSIGGAIEFKFVSE